MRCEEREGAKLLRDVAGAGEGERQAIVGARAAADLVHQHEAPVGRRVQDHRRLRHFDHESGAAARQVVRGADSRENPVEWPDHRPRCGHEAADRGEHEDERGLAHVGRLAAHVGTRDHEHAATVRELEVVRDEGIVKYALDDGMPAALDPKTRLVGKIGLHVAQAHCALSKVCKHVGLRECRGHALERCELASQAIEQGFENLPLARKRAVTAAKHLVFELLELRRDVSLRVLDGLASHVVDRRALRLASRQFDVVALDAVVPDLELAESSAAPLALLELEQVIVSTGRDRAQLVERGVVSGCDDTTLAQEGRRRRNDRALKQVMQLRARREIARGGCEEWRVEPTECRREPRQLPERFAEGREVARLRGAQCHAREHALYIADAAQNLVQGVVTV